MTDRQYGHVPETKLKWHAIDPDDATVTSCGRDTAALEFATRVPAKGRLCGNCARVIAAQTDGG